MASATLRLLQQGEGGTLTSADVASLRDLTARYLKALEGQRAASRLLATAAHELRHPLQLMKGALARRVPNSSDALRTELDQHIHRMARLIADLIDLAAVETEGPPIRRQALDLFRLLSGLLDEYRPVATAKGVRITLDTPQSVVWLDADPDRLMQVFCNLIDNALKYTPGGGAVAVEARVDGDTVEVHLRDTGPGFPAGGSSAAHDDGASSLDRRLGLGLSIAARIVERHGGALLIRNDGPARGTHVLVTLPRSSGEPVPPGPAPAAQNHLAAAVGNGADRRPAPVSPLREIESAFREMPGLILTVAQAARLFSRDEASVRQALDALVAQGALRKIANGYVRLG